MIKFRGFCKAPFFRLKISNSAANLDFLPEIKHLHVDDSVRVPSMRGSAKCNHEKHVKFVAIW